MAKSRKPARVPRGKTSKEKPDDSMALGQAELVVMVKSGPKIRSNNLGLSSASGADVSSLDEKLKKFGSSMTPLFGLDEDRIKAKMSLANTDSIPENEDLSLFYSVDVEDDKKEVLCKELIDDDHVEAAYVKPPIALATLVMEQEEVAEAINDMMPASTDAPPASPNFQASQGYLGAAPAGVNAFHAWTIPGGKGDGVKVIDCEWGWNFTHEDLNQGQIGVVVGTGTTSLKAHNHGTAVMGEISGDVNGFGITGISPNVTFGAASFVSKPSAQTIRQAADKLSKGDILLLEIHRGGPNYPGGNTQMGFIAVEWWPDDFAAIRYAVNKGIIVVEAAGNGSQNFDTAVYNTKPSGFPSGWKNPLNPANPSSGAVVVGAGAPPPGTHGNNHGADRSRLGFSNYGARLDCQGWGREVTSTGYGNLQGGASRNTWYTDSFSGTSSASPIVVGALACVQGILKKQGSPLLTSWQAISLVRTTGSPQQSTPGRPASQRIGRRPNLTQMIPAVANKWITNKAVKRTHVKRYSKAAWAIVGSSGWIRIKPSTPDAVTNMLVALNEALANNRKVDIKVANGQIEQVTLR